MKMQEQEVEFVKVWRLPPKATSVPWICYY